LFYIDLARGTVHDPVLIPKQRQTVELLTSQRCGWRTTGEQHNSWREIGKRICGWNVTGEGISGCRVIIDRLSS
jgi:hypothetical protein